MCPCSPDRLRARGHHGEPEPFAHDPERPPGCADTHVDAPGAPGHRTPGRLRAVGGTSCADCSGCSPRPVVTCSTPRSRANPSRHSIRWHRSKPPRRGPRRVGRVSPCPHGAGRPRPGRGIRTHPGPTAWVSSATARCTTRPGAPVTGTSTPRKGARRKVKTPLTWYLHGELHGDLHGRLHGGVHGDMHGKVFGEAIPGSYSGRRTEAARSSRCGPGR